MSFVVMNSTNLVLKDINHPSIDLTPNDLDIFCTFFFIYFKQLLKVKFI